MARIWLTFAILLLANLARAGDLPDGLLVFRDRLAPESTLEIELVSWPEAQQQILRDMLGGLWHKAPGLVQRAAQAGPISAYLTSSPTPSHPAAAWVRRGHEASLVINRNFFRTGIPNGQGVEYNSWLFVHEIAHLADPVEEIVASGAWARLIGPRREAVIERLAAEGLSLRDAMFQYRDEPAVAEGFPGVYAAMSPDEALAEYAAVRLFASPGPLPGEVREFIDTRLLSPPSEQERRNARAYRKARLLYRQKNYAEAERELNAALRLSPVFGLGLFLRGYVRLAAGNPKGARSDWLRARGLIPDDNRKRQEDIARGLARARELLGE